MFNIKSILQRFFLEEKLEYHTMTNEKLLQEYDELFHELENLQCDVTYGKVRAELEFVCDELDRRGKFQTEGI